MDAPTRTSATPIIPWLCTQKVPMLPQLDPSVIGREEPAARRPQRQHLVAPRVPGVSAIATLSKENSLAQVG